MNKTKIQELLTEWAILLTNGEKTSREKASKNTGGLSGTIKRTTGRPIIFDSDSHADQERIQTKLCKELPEWVVHIKSEPAIMDGHKWTRGDFIYLYYSHYQMVVEKLQKVIR